MTISLAKKGRFGRVVSLPANVLSNPKAVYVPSPVVAAKSVTLNPEVTARVDAGPAGVPDSALIPPSSRINSKYAEDFSRSSPANGGAVLTVTDQMREEFSTVREVINNIKLQSQDVAYDPDSLGDNTGRNVAIALGALGVVGIIGGLLFSGGKKKKAGLGRIKRTRKKRRSRK